MHLNNSRKHEYLHPLQVVDLPGLGGVLPTPPPPPPPADHTWTLHPSSSMASLTQHTLWAFLAAHRHAETRFSFPIELSKFSDFGLYYLVGERFFDRCLCCQWVACNLHSHGEFWSLSVDKLKVCCCGWKGGGRWGGADFAAPTTRTVVLVWWLPRLALLARGIYSVAALCEVSFNCVPTNTHKSCSNHILQLRLSEPGNFKCFLDVIHYRVVVIYNIRENFELSRSSIQWWTSFLFELCTYRVKAAKLDECHILEHKPRDS